MSESAITPGVVFDLAKLPEDSELSSAVAGAIALAASVVLDGVHGPGMADPAVVVGAKGCQPAEIRRLQIDDHARATYGDPQEATEEGAEAVGVTFARRVLGRVVFRRLPKGTGADYLMRQTDVTKGDAYERLECSGLATGTETAESRLKAKLKQLARSNYSAIGYAVVTDFRPTPVRVLYERCSCE